MANVYAALVRKGVKSIDEVPKQLKKQVQAILAQDATE
ncbi:CD1375 family protein [Enterococcus faecium]